MNRVDRLLGLAVERAAALADRVPDAVIDRLTCLVEAVARLAIVFLCLVPVALLADTSLEWVAWGFPVLVLALWPLGLAVLWLLRAIVPSRVHARFESSRRKGPPGRHARVD
ncbi:hypothetical protein ACOBQX_22850 [Actinokineospora sp. G85]|uniref:hypothetical protein n=1 Tax=Actinokineospora sp. G85 TaxID=3406626 RepID=UPI003C74C378